jgi:hypothetical protein
MIFTGNFGTGRASYDQYVDGYSVRSEGSEVYIAVAVKQYKMAQTWPGAERKMYTHMFMRTRVNCGTGTVGFERVIVSANGQEVDDFTTDGEMMSAGFNTNKSAIRDLICK